MAFPTGPSGLAPAVGKLRTKVLRQSLEEGCDGYPKGCSAEVQSTCRYPVFAKFILLDLLGADTHQGSQCFEAESCLKPPLSKAVADSDVYRMNFCPLGGSVHWPIVLRCALAATIGHRWPESGARCLESGRRIFPGVTSRLGDPTCRARGSADERTRFRPRARTRPIRAHPGKWQPPHVARAADFHDEQAGNTMASEELLSDVVQFLRVCGAWKNERREKERRERQGSQQRPHCAAPEVPQLGPSPIPQFAASATPRTLFVESNPSTHTPLWGTSHAGWVEHRSISTLGCRHHVRFASKSIPSSPTDVGFGPKVDIPAIQSLRRRGRVGMTTLGGGRDLYGQR